MAEEAITSLKIYLSNERPIDGIKTLLKNGLSGASKGRCDIQLIVTLMDQHWEVPIDLKGRFSVSPQLRGAIKSMAGVDDVRAA